MLIPDPSNPQAWNRYGYVYNNPINYNDPTRHCAGLISCGLTVLGILPDFQGVANVVFWTRTDNAVVAAGIAVQSEFITGIFFGDGLGLAQLTSEDMKKLDGSVWVSPTAIQGMDNRIKKAIEHCSRCVSETDKLIVAAIAQNGNTIDFKSLPIKNGRIDWTQVFKDGSNTGDRFALIRQDITGMDFGTQFMTKIYMQDLKILMKLGYDLPEEFDDADFDLIDSYVNPSSSPSGVISTSTNTSSGFGRFNILGNKLPLMY